MTLHVGKPHILVIDDDERISALVARYLSDHDMVAVTAPSSAVADQLIRQLSFDAYVVDVMMPGETGVAWLKRIRSANDTPALMLTALGESQDRIAGLESGADDYLPKPFEPKELLLRLNSILRRRPPPVLKDKPFRLGKWLVDLAAGLLQDDTQSVGLTTVEINLLKALSVKPGQPMSREELAERCNLDDMGDRTIDVQVTRLRRKLEDDAKLPRLLQTVRGQGYLLRVETDGL